MIAKFVAVAGALAFASAARIQEEETPVSRVVKLLQNMQKELDQDGKKDKEDYEKMGCWCTKNKYEKNSAITDNTAKADQLRSEIEELSARSSGLVEAIANLEASLKANQESLAQAQSIRDKEASAFHAEDLDRTQAIANLKGAITVLKKHHSFPQLNLLAVSSSKHMGIHKDERMLDQFMTEHDLNTPAGFMTTRKEAAAPKAPVAAEDISALQKVQPLVEAYLQGKMHPKGAALLSEEYTPQYAPQSSEIFGILKKMLEQFQDEAKATGDAESSASSAFASMKSEKKEEIAAEKRSLSTKEQELATSNSRLVEAKEDLVDTENVLAEDQKFLAAVTEQCTHLDAQFTERTGTRQQEVQALSEALSMLTAGDARDAFNGSFNFVQVSKSESVAVRAARKLAASVLSKAAAKTNKWGELAALQYSLKLDAFDKVKKAIDDMIVNLKTQQVDEVKKRDWCNEELQKTAMEQGSTEQRKKNTESMIDDLTQQIDTLTREIKDLNTEISNMQLEMARANENRKSENAVFQQAHKDHTATLAVLTQVYERLQKFYAAKLLQTSSKAAGKQAPPVEFGEYKKNRSSSGALAMIEAIVVDTRNLLAEANKGEKQAQEDYVSFIHESQTGISAMMTEIVNKQGLTAQAREDKVSADSDLKFTNKELLRLADYEQQMHVDCDYVLKNFSIRQGSRQEEIEALQSAKQILAGSAEQ